eukprot:SAG31_NODE_98_length_25640_cov_9.936744_7_plen_97_part_00
MFASADLVLNLVAQQFVQLCRQLYTNVNPCLKCTCAGIRISACVFTAGLFVSRIINSIVSVHVGMPSYSLAMFGEHKAVGHLTRIRQHILKPHRCG